MLDAKIASALNKIIQNSQFKKKVSLEEQRALKKDRFLRGRQIAFMIYDYLRVTGAHDTVLDYADLFSVTLCDDNIQEFDTRWDEILLSMTKIPSDVVLESLYKFRIRESAQLETVLESYDMEIHQKISMPNYQKLKTVVKRSMDQKVRLRNFDATHGKIETGAGKGSSGVERGKGKCYQWKEKGQCSKGDQCSFPHERNDRAPKPTPNPPYLLSHQRHEEEAHSRKRSVRGRSQTGTILRQPCRYYLKGTCSRSPCEYWHPPESQCCKTESVRQCLFPDHKVDEQPNQKPKKRDHSPKKKRKRRQGCCSFCENCTTVGLCFARVRAIRTSEKREVSENPRQTVLGTNQRVQFTQSALRQASIRKERIIAWKNTSQKSSSAKSQRFEI